MADKKEGLSIIDKDSLIEGTVSVQGKMVVAGTLKGSLVGNTVVTVEGSRVDAPANLRELIIGGDYTGDITVYESLRIRSTGAFHGKITCKNLTLEAGGKLEGMVRPFGASKQDPASNSRIVPAGVGKPASRVERNIEKKDAGKHA